MNVQAYECWSLEDIPEPDEERVEGYRDGFGHAPEPGANRSPAYWHGWLCGASDRGRIETRPWMRALAAQHVAASKGRLKQLNGSRA